MREQLYTEISSKLEQFHSQLHRRRLANWVWVIVGMILAKSVQLSAIAYHIPDSPEATARIAKVRRWLQNPHIDTQTLYEPIIQHVLEQWANREVTIMLDGCFVYGDRLQMLRLSLSHCYRALPLAWTVVTTKGLASLDVCESMLEHVATLLKRTRRVTFLAGRGFRDRDWARKCRSLNWDYIIRITNNTTITFADRRSVTAEQLSIKPGQRGYLPRVRLTLEADWEYNLAITWTRASAKYPAELCVVMTNLHADGWVLRHELKRMHIDKVFSIHSIYFWAKPLDCLKELWRVVKSGGLLAITILPKDKWSELQQRESSLSTLYFSADLARMFSDAGFREVRVEVCPEPDKFPGECVLGVK